MNNRQENFSARNFGVPSYKSCCNIVGESAPTERQVSPDKLYRAALLRNRFADTILKAREKALEKVGFHFPRWVHFSLMYASKILFVLFSFEMWSVLI